MIFNRLILHYTCKLLAQQHDKVRHFTLHTMAEAGETSKLEWTRPDQVMQLHRMKLRKRALQARMNKTDASDARRSLTNSEGLGSSAPQRVCQKRKNPFAINEWCKKQKDVTPAGLEISSDNTLFELLNIDVQRPQEATSSSADGPLTFANVLTKLESTDANAAAPKGERYIPIDWTLKTKMRFMSPKAFPWNGKLKTSEEASGTTGFVRCLNIGEKETTLDTSPNARLISFRRSCCCCCRFLIILSLPFPLALLISPNDDALSNALSRISGFTSVA